MENYKSTLVEKIDLSDSKDLTDPNDPKTQKVIDYLKRGYSFITNHGVLEVYRTKESTAN